MICSWAASDTNRGCFLKLQLSIAAPVYFPVTRGGNMHSTRGIDKLNHQKERPLSLPNSYFKLN